MNPSTILNAAAQFGEGSPTIEPLGQGLIHYTYKVSYPAGKHIVLQCINRAVFPHPEDILYNYRQVYGFLQQQPGAMKVPALITTRDGHDYYTDNAGNYWRATSFIYDAYSPALPGSAAEANAAAHCFAAFTGTLTGLAAGGLKIIIPGFHDLSQRYRQFEDTVRTAHINRLLKATHVISELRDRIGLVDFYNSLLANPAGYPTRIMHHDAKISNILFNTTTKAVLCPVDLDTVMPGHYFSDLGDMLRSMACTEDENSTAWENIGVNKAFYDTIVNGYMEGMAGHLTEAEQENIHQSGLLITYMQCLRYTTDFLQNDVYYKTTYPEQNLNRALNQLILLEKLEEMSPEP